VLGGYISGRLSNPSQLVFIFGFVNKLKLSCLLDTGATHTFIDAAVLPQDFHSSIMAVNEHIVLADGHTPMHVIGKITLSLRIGKITTSISAFISSSLSVPCILGQDWITKYSVDICNSRQKVIVHAHNSSIVIPMNTSCHQSSFSMRLIHPIHLAPNHETIVEVQCGSTGTSTALFTPNRKILHQRLLLIPNALVSIINYRAFITIINPTDKVCHLPVNTMLGIATIHSSDIHCSAIHSTPNSSIDSFTELPANHSPAFLNTVNHLLQHLTEPAQVSALRSLLFTYRTIFDTSTPTISHICAPPMIQTGSQLPIHSRVYRTDPMKQRHLTSHIDEMLTHGLIEKSFASWSSPVLLIKKKDGTYRFVVDYRQLNKITERDSYPLPRIDDTLNRLNGNMFFTKLDLKTGYHQIQIDPSDRDKTTFVTSSGMYRFKVMPQGLRNAPSNFQRIMYDLLVTHRWHFCLVYIDDILIFSRTFDEHMAHLNEIFSVITRAKLQLNPHKCCLVRSEIDYLGHTINGHGIRPLQNNVDAILKLPIPTTPTQVHSFVQAANYYRDHIENFSTLAAPLFPYTRRNAVWKGWTTSMNDAFEELKRRLTSAPIFLSFPDDTSPLVLAIDASGEGMGGVLRQNSPDGIRVIKYVSKKFNSAQKRYSTTERECLAMVWCIQKLKEYLWGRPFEVETDHCPLCSFNIKRFHNSRIDRWQLALSEYNIVQIRYKRGQCNCDADLLSRFPHEDSDSELVPPDSSSHKIITLPSTSSPIQLNVITRSKSRQINHPPVVSSHSASDSDIQSFPSTNADHDLSSTIDLSPSRIYDAQQKDSFILSRITDVTKDPTSHPDAIVDHGILYKLSVRHSVPIRQLWLPSALIPDILSAYHDNPLSAHFGVTRTYKKIRDHYFWLTMYRDIQRYIRSCTKCVVSNTQRCKKPGFLQHTPPRRVSLN
jgi:hypothetical protein